MKHKKFLYIALGLFTLFWLIVIFAFSAQNSDHSNSLSYGISKIVVRIIRSDYSDLPAGEQAYRLWQVNVVLRKLAHFFLYTILGMFLYFAAGRIKWSSRRQFGTALLAGLLFSSLDELHQYFVPGRTALIRDVVIDFAGILLGCALLWLLTYLRRRKRERSAAKL